MISAAAAATTAATAAGGAENLTFWQHPEIWLLVAFLMFIALISKPAWTKITAALDARADGIREELDEARRLMEEAQTALANYQRKQRDAAKEAKQILAHAQEEAARIMKDGEAALEATLKRHEALALEKIAQAEARAVDEVKNEAIEVALAATKALLEANMDPARSEALIADAVKELPGKLQ